jgi:hypothetical protein
VKEGWDWKKGKGRYKRKGERIKRTVKEERKVMEGKKEGDGRRDRKDGTVGTGDGKVRKEYSGKIGRNEKKE